MITHWFFMKITSNKKTPSEVFCSTRTPEEITKQKPWVRKTKGFCLGDFFGGSGWTEYRTSVVLDFFGGSGWTEYLTRWFLLFYPVISWIYIFMGNYSCLHIAINLTLFTSNLLCLNVHLNCLSLDNHLVSKQPQWQCHVTMTNSNSNAFIVSCTRSTLRNTYNKGITTNAPHTTYTTNITTCKIQ